MTDTYVSPYLDIWSVRRDSDWALIGVEYTKEDAQELKELYESKWNEPCLVTETYIDNPDYKKQ